MNTDSPDTQAWKEDLLARINSVRRDVAGNLKIPDVQRQRIDRQLLVAEVEVKCA